MLSSRRFRSTFAIFRRPGRVLFEARCAGVAQPQDSTACPRYADSRYRADFDRFTNSHQRDRSSRMARCCRQSGSPVVRHLLIIDKKIRFVQEFQG